MNGHGEIKSGSSGGVLASTRTELVTDSHAGLIEDALDLCELTDEEAAHLASVLKREEMLAKVESKRLGRLENNWDTHLLTRPPDASREGHCKNCGIMLRPLVNPGEDCQQCGKKACRQCTTFFYKNDLRLCKVCHTEDIYRGKSGNWFFDFFTSDSAHPIKRSASEILKATLYHQQSRRQSLGGENPTLLNADKLLNGIRESPSVDVMDGTEDKEANIRSLDAKRESEIEVIDSRARSNPAYQQNKPSTPTSSRAGVSGSQANIKSNSLIRSSQLGSTTSLYSVNSQSFPNDIEFNGEIFMSIGYHAHSSVVMINVHQCRNLSNVDHGKKKPHAYVKSYLLPDKTQVTKRKTKTYGASNDPVFNEALTYTVKENEIKLRTLHISVWHSQSIGVNMFLGEVQVPMDEVRDADDEAYWYRLQEKFTLFDISTLKTPYKPPAQVLYRGDIVISLYYKPAVTQSPSTDSPASKKKNTLKKQKSDPGGVLKVKVIEAQNLQTGTEGKKSLDSYVKAVLLPGRSKYGKKKTPVIKKSTNPVWNTIFEFSGVSQDQLASTALELSVWNAGKFASSNEFIGGLRLNLGAESTVSPPVWMDATGQEITMWNAVITRPDEWIEGTLLLRAYMDYA